MLYSNAGEIYGTNKTEWIASESRTGPRCSSGDGDGDGGERRRCQTIVRLRAGLEASTNSTWHTMFLAPGTWTKNKILKILLLPILYAALRMIVLQTGKIMSLLKSLQWIPFSVIKPMSLLWSTKLPDDMPITTFLIFSPTTNPNLLHFSHPKHPWAFVLAFCVPEIALPISKRLVLPASSRNQLGFSRYLHTLLPFPHSLPKSHNVLSFPS